ncbi:MAG: DUF1572 family protein [Ginsengibacter sp.]
MVSLTLDMLNDVSTLLERDLNKLIHDLNLYKDEKDIWRTLKGTSNSGGNLTLHLLGNLNYFIGATLGGTGYVRERDQEFLLKDIQRNILIEEINKTILIIKNTLSALPEKDLEKDFPVAVNSQTYSIAFMLLFILSHLNYHLGQVNYLRRLIENK